LIYVTWACFISYTVKLLKIKY